MRSPNDADAPDMDQEEIAVTVSAHLTPENMQLWAASAWHLCDVMKPMVDPYEQHTSMMVLVYAKLPSDNYRYVHGRYSFRHNTWVLYNLQNVMYIPEALVPVCWIGLSPIAYDNYVALVAELGLGDE